MKRKIKNQSVLLDHRGNAMRASGMYEGSSPYRLSNRTQWIDYNEYSGDYSDNVSTADWRIILSRARDLYANTPSIRNCVHQIADISVGEAWQPKFYGEDKEWGKLAKDWMLQWFDIAMIGTSKGFVSGLRQTVIDVLRDADNVILLTSTSTGYPKIQIIPAHRIGTRDDKDGVIGSGPYAGYNITNGIIHTDSNIVIGYNVLGKTEDKDRVVSTFDAICSYEADNSDQLRGLSALAPAVPIWKELRDIRSFNLMGIKHESQFAVQMYVPPEELDDHFEDAELREEEDITDTINTTNTRKLKVETLRGGEVNVWRADSGAKLEVLDTKGGRPAPNTAEFLQNTCMREGFLSLRMPIEITYDLNSRGATAKLSVNMAQRRIETMQSGVLYPLWKRVIKYAIAKAISQGYLPKSKDWWKWEPTYPRTLVFDSARETAADIELYKIGVLNGHQLAAAIGYDYDETITEKIAELAKLNKEAAAAGVNPSAVVQSTPNGNVSPSAPSNNTDAVSNDSTAQQ